MIDYPTLLANAQTADIEALMFLAGGELQRTNALAQATLWDAQCERLLSAGLITRYRRGKEVIDNVAWYTFDAIVPVAALIMIAKLGSERLILSRVPLPTP